MLARALYADAPWTILDDPLSAVDAHTEVQSTSYKYTFVSVSSLMPPRQFSHPSSVNLEC